VEFVADRTHDDRIIFSGEEVIHQLAIEPTPTEMASRLPQRHHVRLP
jgi:hypothetical protein